MGSSKCTYFAGAQSTITLHCSTRNKQLQRQNNKSSAGISLHEFWFVLLFLLFFSYILLTLLIYPKKCHVSFFSYTGLLFQTISFSPPSSKEDFPVQVLQFRGHLCYKKTHNLSLCSFFNTSFLLSGWRDLDFSKCQNPLSGWLSDQTPQWS